jgi:hypothetical protein
MSTPLLLDADAFLRGIVDAAMQDDHDALPAPDQHVIYVLVFDHDIVKVGHTKDYHARRRAHRSNWRARGLDLVEEWRASSVSALEDESALMELAVQMGGIPHSGSKEWFSLSDGGALVDAARERFPVMSTAP